jgi:formylglycine-generating enzyme required for sulfatase activity
MKSVIFAAIVVAVAATGQAQTAARRIAIVVGNYKYAKLGTLTGVPEETRRIAEALGNADFHLTPVENVSLDDLDKAFTAFSAGVQPGDVCLVYYSGYAVQNGDDDFLLPVTFDPAAAGGLENNAYPVKYFAEMLNGKKPGIKMFFLEGARRINANIGGTRPGLRVPNAPFFTESLFAIPAREQAVDTPPDQVGLFTSALVRLIGTSAPIAELMPEVLKEVRDKSKGQQEPAYDNKVTQRFHFHEPPKIVTPPPPPAVTGQNSIDREDYRLIPAGTFLMGCVPGDKCQPNEQPQHKVTISKPFWMGVNEVRVASYLKFVAADKTKKRKKPADPGWKENKGWILDSHPISNMKWEDAVDYCAWAGGRLPTEAEWEYAARGGKANEIYPCKIEDVRNCANFYGKEGGTDIWEFTSPVRSFNANPYGLFDLAGNVWEFVYDWYAPDYYQHSPEVDPKGPDTGKQHVRRGGSFYSSAEKHLRISYREGSNAENNVGFRCVMDDTPKTKEILQIHP